MPTPLFRPTTHLIRGTATAALLSFLAVLPLAASASTVCERGRITKLELAGGGESIVHVATDRSPAANNLRYPLSVNRSQFATRFWQTGDVRWRDRLSLLRTAYALQQPIVIISSDWNCMGPMDEFTISLCQVGDTLCG